METVKMKDCRLKVRRLLHLINNSEDRCCCLPEGVSVC